MRCDKKDLLLYAVTDRAWLGEQTPPNRWRRPSRGRDHGSDPGKAPGPRGLPPCGGPGLKALCGRYGAPFLINDDVALTLEVRADGIHVGQSDMEAAEVRRRLGPDRILGVSAQTVEQALGAEAAGADYLGVGRFFPTGTKDDADAVSCDTLKAICAAVRIPVVAIGGIGPEKWESWPAAAYAAWRWSPPSTPRRIYRGGPETPGPDERWWRDEARGRDFRPGRHADRLHVYLGRRPRALVRRFGGRPPEDWPGGLRRWAAARRPSTW